MADKDEKKGGGKAWIGALALCTLVAVGTGAGLGMYLMTSVEKAVDQKTREAQEHDRVLAAGEEQHRVGAFARYLAQDVDCLGFQPVEMASRGQRLHERPLARFEDSVHQAFSFGKTGARVSRPSGPTCRPHSFDSGVSHHQRPARTSSPATTGRLHGAQPMDG